MAFTKTFLIVACLVAASATVVNCQTQTAPTEKIYKGSEVDQKVRVTKKPEPHYTNTARKHAVGGAVVIRCIFRSTGEITNIHVIKDLPDGLTENVIEAAKGIKFKPAIKDGHPVSVWMELQYNFHP